MIPTYTTLLLTCCMCSLQKEEPKPEPPKEPEVKPSGEQSADGVPPEGASEPSKVDIEEVDSQDTSQPMDS